MVLEDTQLDPAVGLRVDGRGAIIQAALDALDAGVTVGQTVDVRGTAQVLAGVGGPHGLATYELWVRDSGAAEARLVASGSLPVTGGVLGTWSPTMPGPANLNLIVRDAAGPTAEAHMDVEAE